MCVFFSISFNFAPLFFIPHLKNKNPRATAPLPASQFSQQLVLTTAASVAGGKGRAVTLQCANADEADAWRRGIEAAIDA